MKKQLLIPMLILLVSNVFGQIVSSNAFLQGNYVEVGIGPCGTFGTSVSAPSGYHQRGGFGNRLGFVADPAQDGWTVGSPNYIGDYFLPGTPEEGFGMTINGISYNNNQLCGQSEIPGSIISYNSSANEVSAIWQGTIAGLTITSRTYVPVNSLYFITEVSVTNTSASSVNNVYFMRNVDPDQEQPLTGNFTTSNAIVYQNPNACNQALASGTGLAYGSYLGLGSIDSRARVTLGGFSNRSASDIWNGIGLTTTGTHTGDEAISIAFNLGNIAPNETQTFAYAYILNSSQLTQALAATNIGFDANGVSAANGSTTNICSGTPVPINLTNTGTYTSWTWSPATGLNTTAGTSVIANITSPVTYTATGSGACGTVNVTVTLNPVITPAPGNAGPLTGPSTATLGQSGLTYSISPVANATFYNWTLPPGAVVTSSSSSSNSITIRASNVSWCGDIVVEPANACNTGGSSSISVCFGNAVGVSSLPTQICGGAAFNVPFTASGVFNSSNVFTAQLSDASGSFASPVTIGTYSGTVSGTIPCIIPPSTPYGTAYRIRVVYSNPLGVGSDNGSDIEISSPVLSPLTSSNPLCNGGNDGTATVLASGYVGTPTYDWSGSPVGDGTAAVTGLNSGTWLCTITDGAGCTSSVSFTITDPPALTANATVVNEIECNGGQALVNISASGGTGSYAGTGDVNTTTGFYTYTVSDVNGCTATASITISEPMPLVVSASYDPIICFGGSAAVTLSATGGTAPYSGASVYSQYEGSVSYTVSDQNGCTGSITVTLTQPQKVEGFVTSTPTGCAGNDGTATVTASGGTGTYSYLWGDGQTTASATNLVSGDYTVIITDGNGCTGSATVNVGTSTGLLSAPGTITGAAGVCRNSSGIVYSVAPVAGAISYQWTLPSGATGFSTSNSITLAFGNEYAGGFLCVAAVNACGAGAMSCMSVPVYATYASQPLPVSGPSIVCGPGVYTFSTSATNAQSYTWTGSSGVTIQSGQGTNTVQVSIAAGFTSGSLQVFASNCYGNSSVRGMLLYGIPTLMNPITGNTFVCAGGTTTFSMNLVPGITTYNWSITGDATLISSGTNATQATATFVMGSAWTSGTVTLTVSNACGSYSRSFTVQSVPNQPGSVSGPNTGLCNLSNVTYTVAAVAGATSYSWTVPAGVTIVSSTTQSITVNFTSTFTGSGSICVTANNACGSSVARCYNITSRLAIPALSGSANVCKSNAAVPYTVTPVAGTLSYTWSVTGGAIITPSGNTASTDYRTSTGTSATIRVNANNSCGASQPAILNVTVNTACREVEEEVFSLHELTAYPNPAGEQITLEWSSFSVSETTIRIIDLTGRVMKEVFTITHEGDNHQSFDLSDLPAGMYSIILETKEGRAEVRVVVE